jgi:hypothetical protein
MDARIGVPDDPHHRPARANNQGAGDECTSASANWDAAGFVVAAGGDDAKAFRERLLASGVLDRMTVKTEPTLAEVADEAAYRSRLFIDRSPPTAVCL